MDLYFSVMQCWPDAKQGDRQLYLPFMKKELTDTRMINQVFQINGCILILLIVYDIAKIAKSIIINPPHFIAI